VGKGSPVLADGKIYVTETNGRFHILRPGKESATPLDRDELKSEGDRYAEIYGSPAIAYGRVYFATEGGLYCLGDEEKEIRLPRKKRAGGGPDRGEGDPVRAQVVPAEVLIRPGESVDFSLRLFDAAGRPLGGREAEWSVEGLEGTIGESGRFTAGTDRGFRVGAVRASTGGRGSEAAVRVLPDLPWSWDFETFEDGESPSYWIGARGKYVVRTVEGNKVLAKTPRQRGLNRTSLYMGPSSLSDYTVEADVLGVERGRRVPDIGLIAGGYILDLQGAHQKLQIRSWTSELRMARETDFAWETGRWYRMKLRVDVGANKATIRGKVWPRDESEPESWTLTAEDPLPIAAGSPGLVGYSPVELYYDNVKVTVNNP
jgi:hypothetical protein